MNTNKYGDAQFEHKANFGSIVVFSDEEKGLTSQEKIPESENQYIHIYQNPETNQWIAKTRDRLSGDYGDFIIFTENLSPVGSIDADQLTFFLEQDQEPQFGDTIMDYYQIDGKLYLQANATVIVEKKGKYGILDEDSNIILPIEMDSIQNSGYDIFEIKKNDLIGKYNQSQKAIFFTNYDEISYYEDIDLNNKENYKVYKIKKKNGHVDYVGENGIKYYED